MLRVQSFHLVRIQTPAFVAVQYQLFQLPHSCGIDKIPLCFGRKNKQNSMEKGQIHNEENQEFPSKNDSNNTCVCCALCNVTFLCHTIPWRQVSITMHLCEVAVNFVVGKSVSPTKSESDYELLIGTKFPASFSLQLNLSH